LTDKFRFIFYLYLDAVLLKYKSSGLHIVTKTISTWLRNNISSKDKNNSSIVRRVLDYDVLVSGGSIRVSDVTRGEGV